MPDCARDMTGLAELCAVLRAAGVATFEMPGLRLTFGPLPAVEQPTQPVAPEAKAPCGHELYEQGPAGCYHGCAAPEPKP